MTQYINKIFTIESVFILSTYSLSKVNQFIDFSFRTIFYSLTFNQPPIRIPSARVAPMSGRYLTLVFYSSNTGI
jgi:hypothetical protein